MVTARLLKLLELHFHLQNTFLSDLFLAGSKQLVFRSSHMVANRQNVEIFKYLQLANVADDTATGWVGAPAF